MEQNNSRFTYNAAEIKDRLTRNRIDTLKKALRYLGLRSTGNKDQLLTRLSDELASQEGRAKAYSARFPR